MHKIFLLILFILYYIKTNFLFHKKFIKFTLFYILFNYNYKFNYFIFYRTRLGERMVSMSSMLVETVSINYEDFNESFLTCGTCLCVYDGGEHTPKLLPCSHTVNIIFNIQLFFNHLCYLNYNVFTFYMYRYVYIV